MISTNTNGQSNDVLDYHEDMTLNMSIMTATGQETVISKADLEEFKTSLRGKLIYPGDTDYDETRKIHNAMIDKHPAMIVRCAGVADIITSVKFAKTNNLLFTVRGAGHNVAGSSVCDGGLVIDLSHMKGIRVNLSERTAQVEPGVTWGELSHELQIFGLAATGGFISTTGVSGLTLGGGLGWLLRKHGLALDNLLSVDVVTAEGKLVNADPTQHADLFWGVRGGGGNFGIVTSFKFRVHPVGSVWGGLVLHATSKGSEALRYWRDYSIKSPEEFTGAAVIFHPPAEFPVPEALHREGIVAMGGVYAGDINTGEQVLYPLRQFGPPAADIFQTMPYSAAQTMADFLWPRGLYNYWKSNFLKELGDDTIATLLEFFATVPSPLTVMVIEHVGDGAMNRIGDNDTAFASRSGRFNFLVTSLWTNPQDSDANIQWTRELWDAMKPFMANAVYLNYMGEEGEDRVKQAYGKKYEKLAILKSKYDPANLFRMNQNITPANT
jgi:FAD/FMN-containing dehydrogenase